MSYEIQYSTHRHRGKQFTAFVKPEPRAYIGGIRVIAIKLEEQWWVVADRNADDDKFEDIGPFPTVEQACVVMRLGPT